MAEQGGKTKKPRGARGGNTWRASQLARFGRGAASATDFASAEELARERPTGLSRRPVPPPGPPPTVEEPPPRTEAGGSWRWVWVLDSVADFESTARAERESTVVSTSVATVPRRRTVPVRVGQLPSRRQLPQSLLVYPSQRDLLLFQGLHRLQVSLLRLCQRRHLLL